MRCITAIDRRFVNAVNETTSDRPSCSNPTRSDPFAHSKRPVCPLGGVAVPPSRSLQTPANLDTRTERELPPGHRQTDEAKKFPRIEFLHGPIAPPKLLKLLPPTIDTRIRLLGTQQSGKESHHLWITIHRGKRGAIMILPDPEGQSLCVELDRRNRYENSL